MPDTTETRPGNNEDVVEKARTDIRQEIREADTNAKKAALAAKIQQEIKDAETPAKEVAQDVQREGKIQHRQEGSKVLRTLVRAAEAAKAGIPVAPKEPAQKLLAQLAEKSLTAQTASVIENNLKDYLLGDKDIILSAVGQPKSQFEQAFDSLRQTDPNAADIFQDLLIKNATQFGRTEDEMRSKFEEEKKEVERKAQEEVRERLTKQQRGMPGEEGVAPPPPLNKGEQARLEQLSNRLQRSDRIKPDEKFELNDRLRTGQMSEEDKGKLTEIGFSEGEVEEFNSLVQKVAQADKRYFHYERYFSEEDQQKFRLSFLREKGWVNQNGFTDEGKRELKKAVYKAINNLMSKVDSYPDADFQTNYSEFHEGYVLRYIQDVTQALKTDQGWIQFYEYNSSGYEEVMKFINNGLLATIGHERELRELFHNVGIYIKTMTPEDLAKYMARYNISLVSSVATDDFSGKIVAMAMNEYEKYLKFDIMKNKGKVRPGLFSSQTNPNKLYFEQADYENLRKRLKNVLLGLQTKLGYDRTKPLALEVQKELIEKYGLIGLKKYDIDSILNFEDWELDRALKYAKGLELTQTIRGFEIIASSRPPDSYKGSADNYYDMASYINPNWKWMVGRGAAGPREKYVPEVLISEGIKRRPEVSLLKRILTKGWNPKEVHEEAKAWSTYKMSEKWEHIKDSWLYRDMDFRRLLNKFGLGGLATRNAWRVEGFAGETFTDDISRIQNAIKEAVMEVLRSGFKFAENGERWLETYDQLARVAGVGTRFWFDGKRATDFVKRELWKTIGVNPDKTNQDELDKLWFEYTMGKRGGEEIFKLPDGQKYTTIDYLEAKTLVFRGLNFYDLLRRSPMDFLNNIINLTPELLTEGLGGTKDIFFEFDKDKLKTLIYTDKDLKTEADRENRLREIQKFQRLMKRVWGEKNFKHLVFTRDFYKRLEKWGGDRGKDEIFEKFYNIMNLAVEKVKLQNRAVMKPDDIDDEGLRTLIFGGKDFEGLVTHFENLNEDFGYDEKRDEKGNIIAGIKDERLGQDGFFYHMARGWYNELGHALHPDSSDVDWRLVFHRMGAEVGENMVKRLWGDLHVWNQVTNDLINFDQLLQHAAHSHNLDKIYELHEKIKTLRPICGRDAMYEMQFYLAQVIGRYFQEHYAARLPFPLGLISGLFIGKELSLSKIYGGKGAMSLTTDGLNAYFQTLMHRGLLPEEGIFGFNRLSRALGADWQKLVLTEIIPNVSMALALFLLFKFMKDALAETEGKKK